MKSERYIGAVTMLLTVFILLLAGCSASVTGSSTGAQPPQTPVPVPKAYDAVVDSAFSGTKGEAVNGVKTYKMIQHALSDAPVGRTEPYKIFIKNGTYYEKLLINKPYITLIGESADQTKIIYDLAAGSKKPDGSEWGMDSPTMTVLGGYFTAENMTIENTFDYLNNMKKTDDDPTKVKSAQALALKTEGSSNHAVFRNIRLRSYQDTLLANAGTQYYDHCIIEGAVDFIYGAGQAVFDHCTIRSLDRGSKSNNGYITAASTQASQKYGFLFINSKLVKESPDMADATVSLGRPWHNKPSVVFVHCFMDSHISAEGWVAMSGNSPQDARFYEYGSTGPGALKSDSRRTLSETQAQEYTIVNVLNGWNPTAPNAR